MCLIPRGCGVCSPDKALNDLKHPNVNFELG